MADDNDTFTFELVSPEQLLLSGDAKECLVPGYEGDFVVMPGHAPILSTLRPGLLDVKLADGSAWKAFVRGGFAEADPTSLTVLAQVAINLDDLDAERLNQEVTDAEEDVADAKTDEARDAAQETLDRLKLVQSTLSLT